MMVESYTGERAHLLAQLPRHLRERFTNADIGAVRAAVSQQRMPPSAARGQAMSTPMQRAERALREIASSPARGQVGRAVQESAQRALAAMSGSKASKPKASAKKPRTEAEFRAVIAEAERVLAASGSSARASTQTAAERERAAWCAEMDRAMGLESGEPIKRTAHSISLSANLTPEQAARRFAELEAKWGG